MYTQTCSQFFACVTSAWVFNVHPNLLTAFCLCNFCLGI
ncbi:hypothetical protein SLEP1_g54622 [Rubroshorea leprosula]|uniref:Uncharacterized protein n=1 Tax=Rubroshorea leprosula TaxID=152421 RepID=A0AAV5MD14_9ROSI|nr:hypothetical protein SLEP1_g54622 [Rubroshorea leprosula]